MKLLRWSSWKLRQRTPAIVRKLGSIPEIIEESGGGLIYETPEELTSRLDRLLEDPEYRNMLGQQAHRALKNKWTPETYLEKYLGLIYKLMDSRVRH